MTTIDHTTSLVKITVEGVPNIYPVFMGQVRRENPDWSFTDPVDEDLLNNLGYHAVYPVDKPVGDVVTEGPPVFENDLWQQSWEVRDFSSEETASILNNLKATSLELVNQRLSDALEIGFEFTFNGVDGPETGHAQLRDKDRANLTGCGLKAERLVKNGVVTPVMPFRTYENVTYMCTPAEMNSLSDLAYDAYLVFMGIAWQIKDAIVNATNPAEIPAIPPMLELPAGWETLLSPPAVEEA